MSPSRKPAPPPLTVEQQARFNKHRGLVNVIVMRNKRLEVFGVYDWDDMRQEGAIGLLDACRRWDPSLAKKMRFATYAGHRIEGQLIDAARRLRPYTRTEMAKARDADDVAEFLDNRRPTSLDYHIGGEKDPYTLHEYISDPDAEEAFQRLFDVAPVQEIARAILTLTPRQQMAVTLYFWEELSMREIAEVMGVTESRISQLLMMSYERMLRNYPALIDAA